MNDRDSNIGQVGVESIRIKGKRIEDLPLGQGNEAKEGLKDAIETQRLHKIAGINSKYPPVRVDYLRSRVRECSENIDRIRGTRDQQNKMISEYTGHIAMCKHRDKEIDKLYADKALSVEVVDAGIKALKKQFLPYNVEAMEKQIVQCNEALERCDKVIAQEYASIKELDYNIALCQQRDKELKQYGAVAEGS